MPPCVAFSGVSNSTESHSLAEHEPADHRAAEPIDLLGYLKRMGHYWIAGLVAAVIVAGALMGFGALKGGAEPVGSTWARAHVMVTFPEPKNEAQATVEAAAAPRIINSYVALDGEDALLRTTASELGDGTTVPTLKQSTNIYWGGGGQIIAFYALGQDENQAAKRADAYAQAFVKDAPTMLPTGMTGSAVPTFTQVGKAKESAASPSPNAPSAGGLSATISSPLMAVIVGVVAGVVVMGLAEYFVGRSRRS